MKALVADYPLTFAFSTRYRRHITIDFKLQYTIMAYVGFFLMSSNRLKTTDRQ